MFFLSLQSLIHEHYFIFRPFILYTDVLVDRGVVITVICEIKAENLKLKLHRAKIKVLTLFTCADLNPDDFLYLVEHKI